MGLRDLLKKKATLEEQDTNPEAVSKLASPEFTFIRSDTISQEVIHPPNHPAHDDDDTHLSAKEKDGGSAAKHRLSLDVFKSSRSRTSSVSSTKSQSQSQPPELKRRDTVSRRLSHRLHLSRNPSSSGVVPHNLPEIVACTADGQEDKEGTELQWEKRATILARENEKHRPRPESPDYFGAESVTRDLAQMRVADDSYGPSTPARPRGAERAYSAHSNEMIGVAISTPEEAVVSTKAIDEDIQEAIRLHEAGELEASTAMFGRLADPKGANNPLSQVLYGLALR